MSKQCRPSTQYFVLSAAQVLFNVTSGVVRKHIKLESDTPRTSKISVCSWLTPGLARVLND